MVAEKRRVEGKKRKSELDIEHGVASMGEEGGASGGVDGANVAVVKKMKRSRI